MSLAKAPFWVAFSPARGFLLRRIMRATQNELPRHKRTRYLILRTSRFSIVPILFRLFDSFRYLKLSTTFFEAPCTRFSTRAKLGALLHRKPSVVPLQGLSTHWILKNLNESCEAPGIRFSPDPFRYSRRIPPRGKPAGNSAL